jgi:putative SOS response-associated peptidase YedK
MSVILQPADEALWLDPTVTETPLLLPLLQPYPAEAMDAYRVAPLVNTVANDGPELIEPSDDQEPATERDQQLALPLLGGDSEPAQG